MSRVGKKPIVVPAGVEVKIDGHKVTVKGPKGTLEKEFNQVLTIKLENGEVVVERPNDEPKVRAIHGTTRALIQNMVSGVSEGFKKSLTLVGVGYRAAVKGKGLELSDRKSTRLNSSHANISYAVFCLKKKSFNSLHPYL